MILLKKDDRRLSLCCHDIIDQYDYEKKLIARLSIKQMDKNEYISGVFNKDTSLINTEKLFQWLDDVNVNPNMGE